MKNTTSKTGRTYGRKTAWLALRSGVIRIRMGIGGSAHNNELCVSVKPYNGGDARLVPLRVLSRSKDRAGWMHKMPIPLMEYPEYPKCRCWIAV